VDKIGVVILAAGQGTRLKVEMAKPMVPLRGRRLVDYPLKAALDFLEATGPGRIGIVLGHKKEELRSYLDDNYAHVNLTFAIQAQQNGTADAIKAYLKDCSWAKDCEYTLVLCADTPLLTKDIFASLMSRMEGEKLQAIAASFETRKPTGYGRIVRGSPGFKIVEEKDATPQERNIQEVNSGLYLLKTEYLLSKIEGINSVNASGEFYLTDIFDEASRVEALCFDDELSFLGVNNLAQLATSGEVLNERKCLDLMLNGVFVTAPKQSYIEDDVKIGSGTIIAAGCSLSGKTTIAKNVVIENGAVIKDSEIDEGSQILAHSYLEQAKVGAMSSVGPFARLRPGTILHKKVKIGNFVETKKATLMDEAKVSHLSYVGDAEIGKRTNLGCGFITCNYDGANKHFTKIGDDCFVGSDSQIIAPVTIGDRSFIAAASTVTQSVQDESFVISRGKQTTKPGLAKKFLKLP
jgi:bifunctional UDP-N-acetylglucosamine pyrophosphorylase / glucosamine-1-phosphate N-acetyltransferase